MSEILFADIDSRDVEAAVLAAYEHIARTTLYPGDPVRLFLESLAYTIALQNNVINLAGRQNLLAYAVGEHLDYIGMMVDTSRLGPSHAGCIQEFWLKEALGFDVSIPAATRVTTADGRARFATVALAVIPAGELSARVSIRALEPGAAYNGLLPGQINQLVDPVAYVSATSNVTQTLQGADAESDDRYRTRIQQAPEAFSCAGPVGAYRFHALAAHPDIAEVSIWTPVPGTVDVRPVLAGGELPDEEVLAKVRAALNADDVRPLTDTVTVQAPELVEYRIHVIWYLAKDSQALLSTISGRVEQAVESYRLWQREMPGRDILPLRLASLMEQAGARRIELVEPAFRKLEGWQLARESSVEVTFGGVEQ